MDFPLARWMTASGNSGLFNAMSALPAASGNIPSIAKAPHAEAVPRSSLPPRLCFGSSVRIWVRTSLATFCAFHGAPAQSYTHGTPMSGSLPMNAYGEGGPWSSWVKKVSSCFCAAAGPPIAVTRPVGFQPICQRYCEASPST